METTFLGETDFPSLSINASGQYVAVYPDLSENTTRAIVGDLQAPLPTPFDLKPAMLDAPSAVMLSDGTALFDWFAYSGKPAKNVQIPTSGTLRPGSNSLDVLALAPSPDIFNDRTPQTAVSSTGGAFRVWITRRGRRSKIWGSFRPAGGTFESPREIYSESTRSIIFYPQVALDANNVPTVVWENGAVMCGDRGISISAAASCKSAPATAYFATGDGRGGFLPAQSIQGKRNCEFSKFDEADSGAALVLMECLRKKGWMQVVALRQAGGTFGLANPFTKIRRDGVSDIDAKMLADGRAIIAWRDAEAQKGRPGIVRDVIRVSIAVAGGAFGPSRALAESKARKRNSDVTNGELSLSASPSGQAYIAAALTKGNNNQIAAVRPDLTLGPLLQMPPHAYDIDEFAVGDSGVGIALWSGGYYKGVEGLSLSRFTVPSP